MDFLRAGRLRALAVLGNKPLEVKNYGIIQPITNWIPEFETAPTYFEFLFIKACR